MLIHVLKSVYHVTSGTFPPTNELVEVFLTVDVRADVKVEQIDEQLIANGARKTSRMPAQIPVDLLGHDGDLARLQDTITRVTFLNTHTKIHKSIKLKQKKKMILRLT